VVRLIKAREATLVKGGEQAVVLEMPTPGDAAFTAMGGMMPGAPGVAPQAPQGFPPQGVAPQQPGLPAAQQPRQSRKR
jgi:hypothetical protein